MKASKLEFCEFGSLPSFNLSYNLQSIFIKDSNSLGFYNITSATVAQLGLKEGLDPELGTRIS